MKKSEIEPFGFIGGAAAVRREPFFCATTVIELPAEAGVEKFHIEEPDAKACR
jgi:hypothetical protein